MRSLDEVAAYRSSLEKAGVRFVNSVLRGAGQAMFQDNSITGIPVLGDILFESCIFGLYAFPAILPVLTRRVPTVSDYFHAS